jgi:drug/metabolite transporter (DMT)-like permease
MLLVLPFVSTSVLLLREERRRWLRIHGAVLGLAGAIGLLLGMSGFSRVSWMLWGLWLYTFATIAMCVLEVSILRTPEKSVEE